MKVYALVGKSGTGKSYQALNLCKKLNVPAIIDDGLFIYENKIEAGISAKRQNNFISAVKTAVFSDEDHRNSVAERIREVQPSSILLLGTSDKMVNKIDAALELEPISETIYIEDITTEDERKVAEVQRGQLGKHVIPVPTFQLRKDFSGYFLDPMKLFKEFGYLKGPAAYTEKTVVRPTYSYLGDFFISDKVINDVIASLAYSDSAIVAINKIFTVQSADGVKIELAIIIRKGCNIIKSAQAFQRAVAKKIEDMTAFNVEMVNIDVRGIKEI